MRVTVTGGAGFLGARIVARLLARGHQVSVFSRSAPPELARRGITPIQGDLRDAAAVDRAVEGREAVFHVAAKAGVWGDRAEFLQVNLQGTRNVLAACRRRGVRRLVHTSSPSVVFGGGPCEGVDETAPYPSRFLAAYPESKALAEREVLAASGEGGLRAAALRPHLIWGPGDPHLVPRVLDRARRGRLRQIGEGRNRVDITHVEDAADAHLLALDALAEGGPAAGRAYFVSSETVNLWDWLAALLERAGLPPPAKTLAPQAAYRLGALLEGIYGLLGIGSEPPMTRFVARTLATSHWFDTGRARRELGYAPSRIGAAPLQALFAGGSLETAATGGAGG